MEKIKLYKKNLYKKNVSLFLAVSILLSLTALPSISFGASNTTSVFFSHTEKSENRLFIKTSYNDDTLTEAGVKELSDFKITADQLTSSDGADYEAAVAAKESLNGSYEDRFIAVSYETSVPDGISSESFERSTQIGFQLALNSDEITGAYTSGEFSNEFTGYYNGWDPRYWEMYYLSPEGQMTALMMPSIIDPNMMGPLYFGDYAEQYPGYFLMGMNLPSTAMKGTLLIVQKKPTAPESLTDGIYHVPADIWKTGSDEPSMGNDAITDHMAVLEVKDGKWSVTLNWHSMEYTNLVGHILDMKYYESEEGYRNYKADRVEYGSALKSIDDITYQSDELSASYISSTTIPFQEGDDSLYLNVMVDAMGETRQDMRVKFIWDKMVKKEGWFYDLEDGEYDTEIMISNHNRTDPEVEWNSHNYDADDIFGEKARVKIKNGKINYLYLYVPESEKSELLDSSERKFAYENAQGELTYADILKTEESESGLTEQKIVLVGLDNPKTVTDWISVQYAVGHYISDEWTKFDRSYYLSIAYNEIEGKNMTRITGRAELGELLTLAGEEADTTYAEQKAVYDDPVATQEELTAALNAMEEALSGQKETKLEELKNAIQKAQNLNSDSYTETSFAALTEAIETASAVADNQESTLAEILEQISALEAAHDALVADMDWSALDAQIEAAEAVRKSQYTASSYRYMYDKLAEAREMRALPDTPPLPSQEEIDELAAELEARIASLVPLGSGSGGDAVVFEPASEVEFAALRAAVEAAKAKLGASAGENVILQAAESALEEKEISSDGVGAMVSVLCSLEASSEGPVTADRTALDALMKVAEEIVATNDGTYQSVEGLSEAIAAAQTYLNFADGDPAADTIEMASSVLREAFASLVRVTPEDEGIDVDNLAAGKYTVPISIKNAATPSQDSMANDAVEPDALITVGDDGTAAMQLTFKPKYLESFDQWGHLLRSWLYQGTDPETAAENAYNVTEMTLMDLSGYYTVNEENPGEQIPMDSDPENPDDSSQYPGTVTFTMPYVSTQDGYETIYIRVSVDAMGGDSGAQNALLKIDYSQIQKLDDEGNVVDSGVNRAGVAEAIADAETLLEKADHYTAASLNDLRVALTAAYAARYQENAEQDELDAAEKALQNAADGLVSGSGYVGISPDYLTDTLNAGVFAEAASGTVPANAALKAGMTTTINYVAMANKLGAYDIEDFIPYTVSVIDENGSSVQTDGSVTVKIYVPEGWNRDRLTVYYLENLSNSRPQEISGGAMDKDGFFVFETDSFGYFALAEMGQSTGSGYQTGTVTFSAGDGGTLTAMVDGVAIESGDEVEYGKEVVFTATPDAAHEISSWSGISGSGNPVRTVISGDLNVSVHFMKKATGEEADGKVTFAVSGGGGTIKASVDGEEIRSGDSIEGGKTVLFTAEPSDGHIIDSWSGDASGSSDTAAVLVDGDIDVSVSFKTESSEENPGGGSGGGSGGSGGGSQGGGTEQDTPQEEEEFFLSDGYYYVDVDLWKTAANEASMGNVAFSNNDRALVRVEDGEITAVQIATNPVDVDQYHSAIVEFDIPDASNIRILEKGTVTTEPAGNEYEYIKRIQFDMPREGQPSSSGSVTYVDVTFKVPDTPMDSAVGETLSARLRFTWNTASKTGESALDSNDETGAGTSSITGEKIEDIALVDKQTGIRLETNTERLSNTAKLNVSVLSSGKDYDTAAKAMEGIEGEWSLYKIETKVGSTVTAPQGSVTLSFPYSGKDTVTVYRISDSGSKTLLKGEAKDGYYVINTSSLGLFAVVGADGQEVPPAEEAGGDFTDMKDHWAEEYVDFVVERGLFNGVSDTEFSPDTSMTRSMFVTAIGRLAGVSASDGVTRFEDVAADSWYAPYVAWAAENGIVTGTSETTFDPDRAITRQEMAALLSRYAEFAEIELTEGEAVTFTDSDEISGYAKEAVAAMASVGLIEGMGDGTFAPKETATRAEVATLLARFMQGYSL